MELWNAFKIDSWWKCVIICGISTIAASLLFDIEIVNRKHLIGVGLGMFIVGISNWIALKTIVHKADSLQGFFYGKEPIHNTSTKAMQTVGVIITTIFGCLIVWNLF